MNKKLNFAVLLMTITGLLLAACSSATGTPGLGDTNWKLVSYGSANNQIPAADGIDTSVKFGSDGQVSGTLGCNSFGGDYEQDGTRLVFGPIMSTMMACPETQMSQESISFSILNGTVDFRMDGDNLTITGVEGDQLILMRQ